MSDHAIENACDWYETIQDQLRILKDATKTSDADYENAREQILESPLSVRVRSGYQPIGETLQPAEFEILLSTGGPALRIVGDLGLFSCPEHCRMEWSDWGHPWTTYSAADSAVLDAWAAQFYFGEG